MATFVKSFFIRHPLAANSIIYGSLYVGAELSQQVVTKKYLVSFVVSDNSNGGNYSQDQPLLCWTAQERRTD